jgi:hypothetical protein
MLSEVSGHAFVAFWNIQLQVLKLQKQKALSNSLTITTDMYSCGVNVSPKIHVLEV